MTQRSVNIKNVVIATEFGVVCNNFCVGQLTDIDPKIIFFFYIVRNDRTHPLTNKN